MSLEYTLPSTFLRHPFHSNSFDSVDCIVQYISNCGTGVHQEIYDLVSEQFSKSVDQFCKSADLRNGTVSYILNR